MQTKPLLIRMVTALLFLAQGCSGIRNDFQEKITYRLTAAPAFSAVPRPDQGRGLLVKRFAIAPEFEADTLTYRTGPARFRSDYFHSFMVPPARMITELVMETLYASPRFSPVTTHAMSGDRYQLSGKIIDLYVDIRAGSRPAAVIAVRLALEAMTRETSAPLILKTYTARVDLSGPGPDACIHAMGRGLTRILEEFYKDLPLNGTADLPGTGPDKKEKRRNNGSKTGPDPS